MRVFLIIFFSVVSAQVIGQSDTTYKQNVFLNYGVEVTNYKFSPYIHFVHFGYERQLNEKWSLSGSFKKDKFYTTDWAYDYRIKLNDTVTIHQMSLDWNNENSVYQLHLGANRKLGNYFSFGGNLLLGYSRKELVVRFSARSYNPSDSTSYNANCQACLETYLGDAYEPNQEYQDHSVGHSNKLSLGASFLFKFEYPISKRLDFQLKYGTELYYDFDLGNTIDFKPHVDFYPHSYFRANDYLTTGLSFKF